MNRFDVLQTSCDVFRPYFLEASAGTGKTFAIEHVVVRMIVDNNHECSIDQILVVTFTKAATRELRARIRSTLQKTYDLLKEQRSEAAPEYLLHYFQEEHRFIALLKIEEALHRFDQAQIYTIHGFCSRMLSDFPFDSLINMTAAPDENQMDEIIQDKILNYFQTVSSEKRSPFEIQKLMGSYRHDIKKLITSIEKHASTSVSVPNVPSFRDTVENVFQILKSNKPVGYEEKFFVEDCYQLSRCYRKILKRDGTFPDEIKEQIEVFSKGFDSFERCLEWLQLLLRHQKNFLELLDEGELRVKQSEDLSFHFHGLILKIRSKLLSSMKELCNPHRILLSVVADCRKIFEGVYDEFGVIKPDNLLVYMQKALRNEEFLRKVQSLFKAAIIDEFQDTDPLQWDIFSLLFLNRKSLFPLFLVGDPKQSIYYFRHADLKTYLKAFDSFDERYRFCLDTNYRSTPELIHSLNFLFSKEMAGNWLSHDGSLLYHEIKPSLHAKSIDFKDGKASIILVIGEHEELKTESVEKELFPFIACEIQKIHKENILPLSGFAVLVKDRFQGQRLKKYLEECDISSFVQNAEHLKQTKSFSFIKAFAQALHFIEDISYLKALVAHPFIGFDDEILKKEKRHEVLHLAYQQVKSLREILAQKGFNACWHEFSSMKITNSQKTFSEQVISLGGIQDVYDCQTILDVLLEKIQSHSHSTLNLMIAIEEMENLNQEKHFHIRRKYLQEKESVVIMTTHASKGLEFDVVFALGVSTRFIQKNSKNSSPIRVMTDEGVQYELFDEKNEKHQQEVLQEQTEKMRQFYVALTRAKYRIYLPLILDESSMVKGDFGLSCTELFFQNICAALNRANIREKFLDHQDLLSVVDVSSTLSSSNEMISHTAYQISPPDIFQKQENSARVFSFSSLSQHMHQNAFGEEETIKKEPALENELYLPSGSLTGELIHIIIEKIFDQGIQGNKERIQRVIKDEIFMTSYEVYEGAILEMIMRLLSVPIPFGNFSKSLQETLSKDVLVEMGFLYAQEEKTFLKGFIDALIVVEGRYYILDWKTNDLGTEEDAYEIHNLEICMRKNNYFLQIAIYVKALKAYLKSLELSEDEMFGGVIYLFLRGLNHHDNQGIYCVPHEKLHQEMPCLKGSICI